MRSRLSVYAWTALAVAALVVVVLWVFLAATASGQQRHVIWTSPAKEKIRLIRTGHEPKSLLVLSERREEFEHQQWVLRKVTPGKAEEVARGPGRSQGMESVALSQDGKYCLVGWRTRPTGGVPRRWGVSVCDTTNHKKWDVRSVPPKEPFYAFAAPMQRPFSPDSKYVVLSTPRLRRQGDRQTRFWLVDWKADTARLIPFTGHEPTKRFYLAWTRGGRLVVYDGAGYISQGDDKQLRPAGTCPTFSHDAYISADGQRLTAVRKGQHGLTIFEYDVSTKKTVTLYEDTSPEAQDALVSWIQGADYSGERVLQGGYSSLPVKLIYISPKNRCKTIRLRESEGWETECAAIWEPGRVAVVSKAGKSAPDQIVVFSP